MALKTSNEDALNGGPKAKKLIAILVPFFAIVWFVFSFGMVHYDRTLQCFNLGGVQPRGFGQQPLKHASLGVDLENFPELKIDKLLGGLLIPGFDEESCLSRYNSALYRKPSAHNPSSTLISKLRLYEALHKRCGPHTQFYRKAIEQLNSGKTLGPSDCNYVVWLSFNGLGNRILSLTSAFLYALLTNRILLVDRGKDMADLFCEPFPDASWLLPTDFPLLSQFNKFNQNSNQNYGNMLKNKAFYNINDTTIPPLLYLYLVHDYDVNDERFFCDQTFLQKVPWLIIKTDNYFIPSLFLIPPFEKELNNLFPEKETVFHLLGRYLFHPTNQVWGLITRFYQSYLEKADEKIGVQIRVFGIFAYAFDQVLSCLLKEGILPETTNQKNIIDPIKNRKSKSVIVTSLRYGYFEQLWDMYWKNPTTTGEVISFFQPSHEQYEQNEMKMHNMKAWAEMYLLSLTDKLVTSSRSTFGYVAQGLGGLRPWILSSPENLTISDPPCHRAISMEPCFHAPPSYDCKKRTLVDTNLLVPHIRHCEDMKLGLKLVNVDQT